MNAKDNIILENFHWIKILPSPCMYCRNFVGKFFRQHSKGYHILARTKKKILLAKLSTYTVDGIHSTRMVCTKSPKGNAPIFPDPLSLSQGWGLGNDNHDIA